MRRELTWGRPADWDQRGADLGVELRRLPGELLETFRLRADAGAAGELPAQLLEAGRATLTGDLEFRQQTAPTRWPHARRIVPPMATPTSELAARSRTRDGGMFPQSARPERREVRVIEVGFGSVILNGPQAGYFPKARIWLLAGPQDSDTESDDPQAAGDAEFVIYVPAPTNDRPGRRSFGPPAEAQISGPRWQLKLQDSSTVSVTLAPCGCGAGLLATAGPIDGPYRIVMVRRPNWVTGH